MKTTLDALFLSHNEMCTLGSDKLQQVAGEWGKK